LKSSTLFDGTRSETSASDDLTKPDEPENSRRRQKRSSVVDTKYWLYRLGHGQEDHTITSTTSPSTNLSATTTESADILNARAYLRQGPELFHTRQEMRRNREKNRLIGKANRQYEQCSGFVNNYNKHLLAFILTASGVYSGTSCVVFKGKFKFANCLSLNSDYLISTQRRVSQAEDGRELGRHWLATHDHRTEITDGRLLRG
jgi:hypothetical protein